MEIEMADYLIWLIAGLVLVIAELITGTFFLLVLGIGAFAGAAVAWGGLGIWPQTLVAAAVAVAGVIWVHFWRKGSVQKQMPSLDLGQRVVFESWVSKESHLARVRYRDTTWDAHIDGPAEGQAGEVLFIVAVNGSTLEVSKSRPA
jgi:membrane protein implicated in regulation of membrane protease activity